MKIIRRLFVVPLADNDHGKTTIISSLASQGLGDKYVKRRKSAKTLTSPFGREIDAYIFGRSYQEVEKGVHGSVEIALHANDPTWFCRQLIIMPSHITNIDNHDELDDVEQMIQAAHGGGFDAICASVEHESNFTRQRKEFRSAWSKNWDERWTIPNPHQQDPTGQLDAIGRDLWTWISKSLGP